MFTIKPSAEVTFIDLVCRACLENEEYYRRLPAGSIAIMKRLSAQSEHPWKRLALTPQQISEIRPILDSAIRQTLGRRPKTLGFLNFR